MALPKEPRQMMINMMYLVLIAMLAMNVSAEILKAFRLVQVSLDKSNKTAIAKVEDLYGKFEFNMKNDPKKTKPYYDKALEVKKLSGELFSFIVDTKGELEKLASDGVSTGDAAYTDQGHGVDELKGAKNQDFASELFVLKKKGDQMKEKINATRQDLLAFIDEGEREKYAVTFPLEEAKKPKVDGGDNKSWAESTFENMPAAAVVTLLSKYESDVKAAEIDVLSYLLTKIGAEDLRFDALESVIIPRSSYITSGEDYNAKIFVSAYSSTQKPAVFIGELDKKIVGEPDSSGEYAQTISNPMKVVKDSLKVVNGKGFLDVKSPGIGPASYEGAIRMKKPNGQYIYFPFKSEYTVGKGGVVVSPDKMNVLYIGVDNPISVSVPGFNPDQVKASLTQGSLRPSGKGKYTAKVVRPGKAEVVVSVIGEDGKSKTMGRAPFRVKRVPDPVAKVAGQPGGNIPTGKFKVQRGIIADLENFDFNIRFNIVSYEMIMAVPRQDLQVQRGRGPVFTNQMKQMIQRAKPGTMVTFNDIRAKGPDGSVRKLPSIAFQLK